MIKTLVLVDEKVDETSITNLVQNRSLIHVEKVNGAKINFKEIRKILKKENCSRIISFDPGLNRFDIYLKSHSVWTKIKFENLVYKWFSSNDFKLRKHYWNTPAIFKSKGSSNIEISFPLNFNQIEKRWDLFNWFLKEDSLKNINGDSDNYNNISIDEGVFDLKNDIVFYNFLEKLPNKLNEIRKISYELVDDDKVHILTNDGEIFLNKSKDNKVYYSIILKGKKMTDLFFSIKAYRNNIKAIINEEERIIGGRKKINWKDLLTMFVSIIVIAILTYVTFNFIFGSSSNSALSILFSGYTWSQGWIYLLIFNFIFSLFLGMFMSILIHWFTPNSGKLNYKTTLNMWVSLQIRAAAAFITTNAFLATFIWGIYVVQTTKIRTVGFVGMVASLNMLRAMIMMPIGFIFMVRGTFYSSHLLIDLGQNGELITYSILSWGGWLWSIIHNLSVSIFIILPPLHIFYNYILEKIHWKKGTLDSLTDSMTSFEMQIRNIKTNLPNQFKNYKRMIRLGMIIIFSIILETFEFTYSLRMVENYNKDVLGKVFDKADYFNVFAISSIRYMSSFVHHFPILNIIPGQGIGISDFVLNDLTNAIVTSKHHELSNDISGIVDDISSESSLIIRFFNFYLKKAISLIITLTFLIYALFIRKIKR